MFTRDSELMPLSPVRDVLAREIALGYGRTMEEARIQATKLMTWMQEPEHFTEAKAALTRIHTCYNARKN